MKTAEIRKAFLDYFKNHSHKIVSSSPLIPAQDPTLLFTNAGMVQFKDTFLGVEKRQYTRAASSQKCLRAGGKHNDLENVGFTARHHTFFEMLGNFSFGDYFKREAIKYSWDFLTNVLHLPEEKLWVTVYQDDDEAADIWLNEMKVAPLRFSRCGEEDNFWSMGDTGPCGPCSEIYYDHGEDIAGGPPGTADAEGDRYVEIWNLVFMQYNRDHKGTLHPLPKPSVDTGMGLERITAVVQGVYNNYDIDSFQYLIKEIASFGNIADLSHPSLKVIADHIRAVTFLIVDGVIPSNEGRGYVLRRIIRRALRHGNKLGFTEHFFNKLVRPLVTVMGDAYPELKEKQQVIEGVIGKEEEQFASTLKQGMKLLLAYLDEHKGIDISGEVAFKLYDTYGFPVDLTQDVAREYNVGIDLDEFDACMQLQKSRSKESSQFAGDYLEAMSFDVTTEFKGYESTKLASTVVGLLNNKEKVTELKLGDTGAVILKETPFYAESGGQVGDKGEISGHNFLFKVTDTKKIGNAFVHYGEVISGVLKLDNEVQAQVAEERRDEIRLNHSATHLLHAALKEVVGPHVEQKGSLVEPRRARFDFSHTSALTISQVRALEALVNDKIRENIAVDTAIMAIEDAKKSGAQALFGEKYDESVRVLSIGDFSKELCGGTHVKRTGDIGLFKITSEFGIASGVRRIEMLTGKYALMWVNDKLDNLESIAHKLKTKPEDAKDKLEQTLKEFKNNEKALAQLQERIAKNAGDELVGEATIIGDVKLLIKNIDNADGKSLRTMLDKLKDKLKDAVIVLYTTNNGKLSVVAGVSKSILAKVPAAPEFVKHLCDKGGGRDDMAQGGSAIPSDLEKRVSSLKSLIN